MTGARLIDRVLSPQRVPITLRGPLDRNTEILLLTPDLRHANYSVRGDGGPTYKISLPVDRTIQLVVKTPDAELSTVVVLNISELAVESPNLPAERDRTPLRLTVPWKEQGLSFQVFFNSHGRVAHTSVTTPAEWRREPHAYTAQSAAPGSKTQSQAVA